MTFSSQQYIYENKISKKIKKTQTAVTTFLGSLKNSCNPAPKTAPLVLQTSTINGIL